MPGLTLTALTADQEAAMQAAPTSPLVWGHLYLGHHLPKGSAPMHAEWLQLALDHQRVAIAAPRAHAKSTLGGLIYPLWRALEHPGEEGLLMSASEDLAGGWLRKIKRELEGNPLLRHVYGPQNTGKWTELTLELKNGSLLKGVGAEAMRRGRRPDFIVGDDLENDEMVRSERRREEFRQEFWSVVVNMLEAESSLLLLGTILGITSFLAELVKTPPPGWVSRLDAEPESPETAADDAFLWPEHWPRAALVQRKAEIGSRQYLQEFCNNPMPDDVAIFKEPWFSTYDELPLPDDQMVYFGGVDLGCRQREVHDYTALVVFAVAPYGPQEGQVYLLDAFRGHWTAYEALHELFLRQRRWPKIRWGVETIQYQYNFLAVLQREAVRQGLGTIPVDDWGVKPDKVLSAREATIAFEQGRVRVRASQRAYVDELLVFPQGTHDDWVDATSMAFRTIHTHFRPLPASCRRGVMPGVVTGDDLKKQMLRFGELSTQHPGADPLEVWDKTVWETGIYA